MCALSPEVWEQCSPEVKNLWLFILDSCQTFWSMALRGEAKKSRRRALVSIIRKFPSNRIGVFLSRDQGKHTKTMDRFPHSKFSQAHNHVSLGLRVWFRWSPSTLLSWSPNNNCNNCIRSTFIKTIFYSLTNGERIRHIWERLRRWEVNAGG